MIDVEAMNIHNGRIEAPLRSEIAAEISAKREKKLSPWAFGFTPAAVGPYPERTELLVDGRTAPCAYRPLDEWLEQNSAKILSRRTTLMARP